MDDKNKSDDKFKSNPYNPNNPNVPNIYVNVSYPPPFMVNQPQYHQQYYPQYYHYCIVIILLNHIFIRDIYINF